MNRRNCLKLLAAVLPCAFVARMLGEKDLHGTPSPMPTFFVPPLKGDPPFSPSSGFHTEIHELSKRYDMEGNELLPCFRATIRDCKTNHMMAVESPGFTEANSRRLALTMMYQSLAYVIRRRQFPKDTMIYDVEKTPTGLKWTNPRYPNE